MDLHQRAPHALFRRLALQPRFPCATAAPGVREAEREEDFGQKCQRWAVTRDSAWRREYDGCNIAVFKRTLLAILHSQSRKITSADVKIAWFNLTP